MLVEEGRVVAVDESGVWVQTISQTSCGGCSAQSGCGHGLLNRLTGRARNLVRVLPGSHDPARLSVNDLVSIGIPDGVVIRGSLVVYMLPLVCMLAAALFAQSVIAAGDAVNALMGGAGLLAGVMLIRWHARYHRDNENFQPTLLEVTQVAPTQSELHTKLIQA